MDEDAGATTGAAGSGEPWAGEPWAGEPGESFWGERWVEEREFDAEWGADVPVEPDAVSMVLEVDTMVAVFTAQRFVRVDEMRRRAVAEGGYGVGAQVGVGSDIVERSVRLELASALRVTEFAAGALMAQAEALVHRYPAVLESLSGARITETHARVLVEAVDTVEPELRGRVVAQALALAESLPVGSFRRRVRALVETVRAVTAAARHEEAVRARRVVVESVDGGMAWLSTLMPAVEAQAIFHRVTAIAKVLADEEGESRTLDQLRADVVGDLLVDGDTRAHPERAHGIRATVAVTVPALTLLGASTAPSPHSDPLPSPAWVEGVGPIPVQRARELCGAADGWMRVLTHPETGAVLSVGRTQYRPPPSLRRLVRWRADRCMAPGCGIPAARCEIDHTIAWEHGGHTALNNLAPLCKGHHTVKHHGGWRVEQLPDSGGSLQWTSPAGRRYVVHPERRTPTFAPSEPPPF